VLEEFAVDWSLQSLKEEPDCILAVLVKVSSERFSIRRGHAMSIESREVCLKLDSGFDKRLNEL